MDVPIIDPDLGNFAEYAKSAYGSDNGSPTTNLPLDQVLLKYNNGTKLDTNGMIRILHFIHRCNEQEKVINTEEQTMKEDGIRADEELKSVRNEIKSGEKAIKMLLKERETGIATAENERMASVIDFGIQDKLKVIRETLDKKYLFEEALLKKVNTFRAMQNINGIGAEDAFDKLVRETIENLPTEVTAIGMSGDATSVPLLLEKCLETKSTMRGHRAAGANSFGLSLFPGPKASRP